MEEATVCDCVDEDERVIVVFIKGHGELHV